MLISFLLSIQAFAIPPVTTTTLNPDLPVIGDICKMDMNKVPAQYRSKISALKQKAGCQ